MVDYHIQMKKRIGELWSNLYPITKTSLVNDPIKNTTLDKTLDSIHEKLSLVYNRQSVLNVKDFGAKGDGITDDTKAIQAAINSMTNKQRTTLIFPPSNGNFYLVSELTIPNNTNVITLQGVGDSRIEFTSKVGIHIKSEYIVFKNIAFINKTSRETGSTIGSILFNDEREYKRIDFDLKVIECDISFFQTIVKTWGRGVELLRTNFGAVSGVIIDLTVKEAYDIEEGNENIQKFKTGYRGYFVKDCRFHYCNQAVIMKTTNDTKKVVQGVQIMNNVIEGGIAYYNGYVRNAIFSNNSHYHSDSPLASLFTFNGFENVTIELNISGMTYGLEGYSKKIQRLIEVMDYGKSLKLSGNLSSIEKNVVTFYKGARLIDINLNVDNIDGGVGYNSSLVSLGGSDTYDGFNISGNFVSVQPETIIINKGVDAKIKNIRYDQLNPLGVFSQITNIV